jgi:hypothetical protein
MDIGTLSFSRNGTDLGVAVEGLCGELFPAFSLYNKGDKLRLVHANCSSSSERNTGGGAIAKGNLSLFSSFIETLYCFRYGFNRMSKTLLSNISAHFKKRCKRETKRYDTANDLEVEVNTSPSSCQTYGFNAGTRIQTSTGEAIVLGTYKHYLWYRYAGSYEAKPWSRKKCKEMIQTPAEFSLVLPEICDSYGDKDVDVTLSALSLLDVGELEAKLTRDAQNWTMEMDAQLTGYLNSLSIKYGANPLELDYKYIKVPSRSEASLIFNIPEESLALRSALLMVNILLLLISCFIPNYFISFLKIVFEFPFNIRYPLPGNE